MHGLGNDFILIDARGRRTPNLSRVVKKLSHRRFGIGFDQALLLLSSRKADFRMEVYNADGGRVEMCGNGIRCLARYIWDRGLSKKDTLSIETLAGVIKPRRVGNLIEVDMGEPILEGSKIPVKINGRPIDYPLVVGDREFRITCVSMGNPHCVIFVEDVDRFPVGRYGPLIETHPLFPKLTNVEFVEVLDEKGLKMRVWERGSGETMACGTGACAGVVAGVLKNLVQRKLTVHLPGGDLKIEYSNKDNHLYMRGPAHEVFKGVVEV